MKHLAYTKLFAAFLLLTLSACSPKVDEATANSEKSIVDLKDEKTKASYMVGLDLAKQIAPLKGEVDIDTVVQALRASHTGEKSLLDDVQADEIRKQFTEHLRVARTAEQQALAAKNLKEGEAFLAENAKKDGVATTASGLQYQVIQAGKGSKPNPNDTVRVNYIGTLLDGRKFEDTYAIDHAAEFALNQIM
ncbi:MAG: FKBP-type peptidyl-prolyl cis-trans isomerase N-terminal domain-containing protein, partial [Methylococcales bacterium]